MICFGNVPANSVLPIFFDAFSGSTGASITISGLAVTDIEVYKGTSMTQRASDNGYTLLDTDGIDLDGITGIHGFSIDLSDNSDASFYAAGSFYTVVVSAVTIDSQTVSFVAATFRIVAAENTAGTPAVDAVRLGGTAQTGRDVGASVLLSSGTGTGQISLSSGAVTAGTVSDKTGYALTSAYDAAKTAAQAGDQMDLVNAPNATAVTAIQSGIATSSGLSSLQTHGDSTWATATGFSTHSAADVASAVQSSASTTPLPANVKKINSVTITGDGSGTPFTV